eukprot:gnl/TRDRNA2_/TRDRNA2_168521_c0_seq3.p1 gnl/TRDRNA2_/TRDRNA2_168521_c0~~gnl/TRDRNA2_/TRDRNA2_168521_c0_seq3.p1  ORF type:complete len:301 (-),score=29.42 gnl/TRDRNA2_/TRDRNA2_168521_c0_seq3:56-958(-)
MERHEDTCRDSVSRSRSPQSRKVRMGVEGIEVEIPRAAAGSVREACQWIHKDKKLSSDNQVVLLHTPPLARFFSGSALATVKLRITDELPRSGMLQAVVMAHPQLYMNRRCSTRSLSKLDSEECENGPWFGMRIQDRKIFPYGRRVPSDVREAVDRLKNHIARIGTDVFTVTCSYGRLRTFVALPGEEASLALMTQLFCIPVKLECYAKFEKVPLLRFLKPGERDCFGGEVQAEHATAIQLLCDFGDTYRLCFGREQGFDSSPIFWFAQQSRQPDRAILGVVTTLLPTDEALFEYDAIWA